MLQTKEQALKKIEEEHKRLVDAYRKLFTEQWGKIILNDLRRACGQDISSINFETFDPNRTMYAEGKRQTWLYINNLLTEGQT